MEINSWYHLMFREMKVALTGVDNVESLMTIDADSSSEIGNKTQIGR